jgi:ferric iron reductase protein FhuF
MANIIVTIVQNFPKKQHLRKKIILSNVTYILKYLLRSFVNFFIVPTPLIL